MFKMPIYLRFYIRNVFYTVLYSFIRTQQHTYFMLGVNAIFIEADTLENIAKIKNDASATFIDKMERIDIGNLPIKAAAESIEAVCDGSGIEIDRQNGYAAASKSPRSPTRWAGRFQSAD